jgi:hypothetical protein
VTVYVGPGFARFFMVKHAKTGENIPNDYKLYQIAINYSKLPLNIPNCY